MQGSSAELLEVDLYFFSTMSSEYITPESVWLKTANIDKKMKWKSMITFLIKSFKPVST